MVRIFVYGTLRKGMYNYDQYLKDKQSFRKYGYIKGKLMSLKGQKYPAFLLEGDDMVLGEIHEVDDEFIKVLDAKLLDKEIGNDFVKYFFKKS